MKSNIERFERAICPDPMSGCWLWNGHGKYGSFRIRDGVNQYRYLTAHRAAWELHRGVVPRGLLVCHRCDVPGCVNINHLFLGTPKENTQDAILKGRFKMPVVPPERRPRGDGHPSRTKPECLKRGVEHPAAKLDEDQVRAIRLGSDSCAALGKKYGVAPVTISRIKRRLIWSHIS